MALIYAFRTPDSVRHGELDENGPPTNEFRFTPTTGPYRGIPLQLLSASREGFVGNTRIQTDEGAYRHLTIAVEELLQLETPDSLS
jgi:hypothetical protein